MPAPVDSDLTQTELREALHYDPTTGVFRWLSNGKVAGTKGVRGYIRIQIAYRRHFAQRLAWLYMKGVWPDGEIDHENRNTGDNRFANLREATGQENQYNVGLRKTNTSGARGVSPTESGRWRAMIKLPGQRTVTHLGTFDTVAAASAVYENAVRIRDADFY